VETVNLKSKTKNKNNIQEKKKHFTFRTTVLKQKRCSLHQNDILKVHCAKHKISKRKHNFYQKYMSLSKQNKEK
jgi:hypothetical protein